MKVTITGATGFVGREVVSKLVGGGHRVHVLARTAPGDFPSSVAFSPWNAVSDPPPESIEGSDAVVHLAGEPVAQRWTAEAKARIRSSRIEGTRLLVNALARQAQRPAVLVSASAIGIYGTRGDEILTEASAPGSGFLADLTLEWERAAQEAERLGIRVVALRFGIVLGHGGALAKMLPPFRAGVGGRMGSGNQWVSWIHIDDAAGLTLFTIQNAMVRGPVNATAPNPVTNREFTRELAAALHRPAVFPVPRLALKLLFGEMADALVSSQRVLPRASEAAGFRFLYPDLGPALAHILRGEKTGSERQ